MCNDFTMRKNDADVPAWQLRELSDFDALSRWLGRAPESHLSSDTALALATRAYWHGLHSETVPRGPCTGVGCVGPFADGQNRQNAPRHRAYVAVQTSECTRLWSINDRSRPPVGSDPGSVTCELVKLVLAQAAGIEIETDIDPTGDHSLEYREHRAASLLVDLLTHRRQIAWSLPGNTLSGREPATTAAVLSGSFNPLHSGHLSLLAAAEKQLGGSVCFEMSVLNAEKAPLDYLSINDRCRQFRSHPVALTCAPTFAEKSVFFPGKTFVIGVDTAQRIVSPRFYDGQAERMHEAIAQIRAAGCRFLVAGRLASGKFQRLADVSIPAGFESLFGELTEQEFREDISSTHHRAGQVPGSDS